MDWVALFAAFGIGSVCTAFVQFYLQQRSEVNRRNFNEKKEAYIGLLNALREGDTDKSMDAAFNLGHWTNRVELVGSKDVIKEANRLNETNPHNGVTHPKRRENLKQLKNAMRRDLDIDGT